MNKMRPYWFAVIVTLVTLLSGNYFMTALGLGLFTFVFVDFVGKIGYTLPILEAMIFIACLQWILGPYIDYVSEYKHYKYYMYVPEEQYMDLVVPSLFFFALPIYFFSNKIQYSVFIQRIQQVKTSDQFAVVLIVIGFLSEIVGRFAPAGLAFVFFLATGLKFVGLLYLFYSGSKRKWIAFWVVLGAQFLTAIGVGLFHGLLLWSVFMLIFLLVFYSFSFARKSIYLSLAFVGIFVLQSVKGEYRDAIWRQGYSGSKVELFMAIFSTKLENLFTGSDESKASQKVKDEETNDVNNRLNQGWIISKIMDNIPKEKPFLNGETVNEAIYSSLFPRFLVSSKLGGGGKYAFEKLTGMHLLKGTAMGVSIIGESYGNYGVSGTYVFMFLWGCTLGLVFKMLFSKSILWLSLPLWFPIIFLQVIKAESDLLTVMNHLVKSTVFVFAIFFFLRNVLKQKI